MTRAGATLGAVLLVAGAACRRPPPPAPTVTALAGDAARVGGTSIPLTLVRAVARSQHVSARAALRGLVDDALLAESATRLGLERSPDVEWASAAVLARTVARHLWESAHALGAPTDDELASVRVIHAVVLRAPTLSRARALAFAGALAQAVSGARDDADFEARALALPRPGVGLRVERLPEFDVSGETVDGSSLDPTFVAAALALRSPGDTSGIVETAFGWHVIRLIARRPPDPSSVDRKRRDLAAATVDWRTRVALQSLTDAPGRKGQVEISGGADRLMVQAAAAVLSATR